MRKPPPPSPPSPPSPPPPPPPPHRPHRPQRFVHHHPHQRFARPLYIVTTPLAALGSGLCHCPHLAALGSSFQVFNKYLEASNVCPNPLALTALTTPTAPTALSASSTPTALNVFKKHLEASNVCPSPPGCPWFGFSCFYSSI